MQRNRNTSLDGLRAISILAILAYHLRLPSLPSGHIGVVVFFVLSGYLATTSLLHARAERGSMGPVGVLSLWGRRIRRLWPSLIAMVAIVAVLCGFLNHVLLTKMRPDVIPALGFIENWSYILRDLSYFDQIGGSSPLLHLWYVCVDLQFFVVWTLVLAILLKVGQTCARRTSLLLALASAGWMVWLSFAGASSGRMYYGTDTRAFSLLLGSWLAMAFPLGEEPVVLSSLWVRPNRKRETRSTQPYTATPFAHRVGLLAFAGLCAVAALVPGDSLLHFRGVLFGTSLLATILIATLLAPRSLMGMALSFPPLVYVGTRAYALYVWHYPIFMLMAADKTTTPWYMRATAVAVALVAAELSVRLIERPFAPHNDQRRPASTARKAITTLLVAATAGYAGYVLVTTPDETLIPKDAIVSTGVSADSAKQLAPVREEKEQQEDTSDTSQDEAKRGGTARVIEEARSAKDKQSEEKDDANATQRRGGVQGQIDALLKEKAESKDGKKTDSKQAVVTDASIVSANPDETAAGVFDPVLIGDSVPGDANWESRLPQILNDSFIGRHPYQAQKVLDEYLAQGVVGKVVVLACFSNSTATPEVLEQMIASVGPDRQVYLVATVNPDGFQDDQNANLRDAANRHDNVHYVDWPATLDGHMEEYLWADNTHLRPEGAAVYVNMVVQAIAQDLVDNGGSVTEPPAANTEDANQADAANQANAATTPTATAQEEATTPAE